MSYWHLTWVAPKLGLLNNLICDLWHTGYWYIFNITTTNTNKKNLLKVLLIQNRRRWVRVWVRVNETRPFSTFWSVCCHRITCTTTFLTFMVRNVWLSEWKENCHWGCGPCSYFESKESVVHSKIYPRICSFWKIEQEVERRRDHLRQFPRRHGSAHAVWSRDWASPRLCRKHLWFLAVSSLLFKTSTET